MTFDRILWQCLLPGQYSFEENNISAKLQPEAGETVLLLNIDDDKLRNELANKRLCDLLFFYRGPVRPVPVLVFVELKGSDYEHGEEQLRNAIAVVLSGLAPRIRDPDLRNDQRQVELRAVLVSSRTVPHHDKRELKRLFRETGAVFTRLSERRHAPVEVREFL